MKKRLFSLVLSVLLVFSILPTGALADDTGMDVTEQYSMKLVVDSVTVGNDDETVQVSIKVERNGGFAGMTYQLMFDKNVLSLEQQPVIADSFDFDFTGGPLEEGRHTAMLSSEENVYGNGTLITYTFKINPEAKAGTHVISLITDGSAALPDGGTVKLEVLDENFVSVVNTTTAGGVTIPGYVVKYDANGGTGAPASQTKSKNSFVYVSSTVPKREGYTFLGWSASSSESSVSYKAGDKYSENMDITLYAVWQKQQLTAGSIDVSVPTVEGKAGDEIELAISVSNHLGINGLQFDVVFDDTKLKYVSSELVQHEDAEITLDRFIFTPPDANLVTNKLTVGLVEPTTVQNLLGDGEVVKIKFKVLDTAEDGFTEISIVPVKAYCVSDNLAFADMTTNFTNGGVDISSQLLGDIDLDEDVDIDDAILLFNYSVLPDVYPIGYKGSVDFDNSGEVDIDDAILLFNYSVLPDIYPIG